MITLSLSDIIKTIHASATPDWPEHLQFTEVSTDSRTIKKGAFFIALVGPNFDGHEFIQTAYERGAAGAIVSRQVDTLLPLLQVTDTRIALGQLAKLWRQQFSIPVIAITGSCGKTTTKAMVASILSRCGETLVTQGTLNNDFGVPLTLLRLTDKHEFAVIEIGTNHFGEIAYATNIAQPTIACILNAGAGHLEFLQDVAGVAREKADIYIGADIAIINADDEFADYWKQRVKDIPLCITFSTQGPADVWSDNIAYPNFTLHMGEQSVSIQLPILGQHNISNALAAAAMLKTLNIPIETIKAGLEAFSAESKRLVQEKGFNDAVLIDDTYNANPTSFRAAVEILSSFPMPEKILIMGDMRELGERAEDYHTALGKQAKESGIHQLYAVGPLSRSAVEAFGEGGYHFPDQTTLIKQVRSLLHSDMVVLVKGSRGMQMENIVAALK
jgi:UDP-N-acetylmuramoyl-tripeptide--D-alanyl-D-alanine ligase